MIKALLIVLCVVLYGLYYFVKTTSVMRKMTKAIDAENTAEFDALLKKYRKELRDPDESLIIEVYEYLCHTRSIACLQVLFQHETAAEWQKIIIAAEPLNGPLVEAMYLEQPDVLRFLLEQGMVAEVEPCPPWLWAVKHGCVDHARVLDEFGANTITPAQQAGLPTLEELLMDDKEWENNEDSLRAVVSYLVERGTEVPAALLERFHMSHSAES